MFGGGFSDFIDDVLGDNTRFAALAIAVLGAHIAVLIASIALKRAVGAMFALNLSLACVVVLYLVTRIGSHPALIQEVKDGVDQSSLPIIAFELVAAGAAVLAFWRFRFAVALCWFAFGLHGLLSAAAIAFLPMVKLTHLM